LLGTVSPRLQPFASRPPPPLAPQALRDAAARGETLTREDAAVLEAADLARNMARWGAAEAKAKADADAAAPASADGGSAFKFW